MFDKPNSSHILGIDRDGNTIRAVELSLRKGKPFLEFSFECETVHVNPLYTEGRMKELLNRSKDCIIVTALKTQEVLIRPLEINLKKMKDIDAVLAFQTEPLLPYPTENALIDRIKVGGFPEGTLLTIAATRKDYVQKHLEEWATLGIEPEEISCVPMALASFSKTFCTNHDLLYVVHLGWQETSCVLVKEGKLVASQSTELSLSSLYDAIEQDASSKSLTEIDFKTVSTTDSPALYKAIEDLKSNLARILYSLAKQNRDQSIDKILLTGNGSTLQNFGNVLCEPLNKQILTPDPAPTITFSKEELQSFAVPLGLAVGSLIEKEDSINFRQAEFVYPHPWRWLKKPLALYYLLTLLLSFALYLFGHVYIQFEEQKVRSEYASLLSIMGKSYPEFEKEYEGKHPHREIGDGILPLEALTINEIGQRISVLQKELRDNPDMIPLLPNTPRVSDLLAWLSVHPIVTGTTQEAENKAPPFVIDSISYSMVKRPEVKKRQEKYQVKVEVEFTTSTPKLAREFHDALIAPNEIVDSKGEVKWSSNRGKYRASFFLKDKTMYPAIKPEGQ